jgi:nicotinate-nucleotide adenylyltransferase
MPSRTTPRKIALFGGAFDPPHVGHALAIRQILDTGDFDEVWVSPTGSRPDKVSVAPGADRIVMVQGMLTDVFAGEPVKLVTHLITERLLLPTTYDELQYLTETYPGHTFTVVIGRDQATQLPQWSRFMELQRIARFLILARDGRPALIPEGVAANVINPDDVAWMSLSSTEIRNHIRGNIPVAGTLLPGTLRYIKEKNLYKRKE